MGINTIPVVIEAIDVVTRLKRELLDEYQVDLFYVQSRGGVRFDLKNCVLETGKIRVQCGKIQIRLLHYLYTRPGRCDSLERIAKNVWKNPHMNRASMRSFFRNLNEKLLRHDINIKIFIQNGLGCFLHLCSHTTAHRAVRKNR